MKSTVTEVESFRFLAGHHNFSGTEVGQSHWVHCEKGPAEVVLPSPAEEVQAATGAAEIVLLCHHWIRPLHANNCLVQLSYQIWPQKTTEGSPDYWANHWHNPSHSPGTVLIQSEQKGWQNHSGPLTSSTLPLWTVTVWSTLQSSEHQNNQTQEQFLPSSNPSHEHLTLNVEHTTLLYITYSPHILIFHICAHIRPVHTPHTYIYIYIYIYIHSGAKKYLVSHQLCKFSYLKRWERPVIFIIGIPQLWETK